MKDNLLKLPESPGDESGSQPSVRGLRPIVRDTLKERIYREVRHALQAGKFEPGEQITVRQLEHEIGAGSMPIRESLQRLAAEGALVNLPTGRVRVPLFTAEEFEEIKEIRLRLEGLAAYRAAAIMDGATLAVIKARYADLLDAVQAQPLSGDVVEYNYRFHFAIYEAAQTNHLISIVDGLWLRVSPLLSIPFKSSARARGEYISFQENIHGRLLDALEARDGRAAEAAIREIIQASAAWYHRHYDFAPEPLTGR